MVLCSWLLTIICSSPQAIMFRVLKHPTKEFYQCTTIDFFENLAEEKVNMETNRTEHFLLGINTESWHSIYHCMVNTEILFLPFLIILISYCKIYNIIYVWVVWGASKTLSMENIVTQSGNLPKVKLIGWEFSNIHIYLNHTCFVFSKYF